MRRSQKAIIFLTIVFTFFVAGCQRAPAPESSSGLDYAWRTTIPVDSNVYTLRGIVNNDAESLVRQREPAQAQSYSAEGVSYGSYEGPLLSGKGMVRLFVETTDAGLAPVGSTVILKLDDTKGLLLQPGDRVTFKCRAQFEAIAAVINRQPFDEVAGTWELDYCRLATPVVEHAAE